MFLFDSMTYHENIGTANLDAKSHQRNQIDKQENGLNENMPNTD